MELNLYPAIFKRRSFHVFRPVDTGRLTEAEQQEIVDAFKTFTPLDGSIKTAVRIVPASKTVFKKDADCCVLFYSEQKDFTALNAGYILEQFDLWCVLKGIGTLWYGFGKPDEKTCEGLPFVIMMALKKVPAASFMKRDFNKVKRKPLSETWEGELFPFSDTARFAPSACNSQPWRVKRDGNVLRVSRFTKPGPSGIMPERAALYFNPIDVGIYLCFLELCLENAGLSFTRTLYPDNGQTGAHEVAKYELA